VVTATAGVPDHKINVKQHYLWRAVDQDGEVVDVFLQAKRDGAAVTTRQLNASSKGYCAVTEWRIGNLSRKLFMTMRHMPITGAEQSGEATRVRERVMRGAALRQFKSVGQAQKFLSARAAVYNLPYTLFPFVQLSEIVTP
jgi:putative transposase